MATPFESFVQTELPLRPVMLTEENCGYSGEPNDLGAPDMVKNSPKGTFYLQGVGDKLWKKNGGGHGTWEEVGSGGGGSSIITYLTEAGLLADSPVVGTIGYATDTGSFWFRRGVGWNKGSSTDIAKLSASQTFTASNTFSGTLASPGAGGSTSFKAGSSAQAGTTNSVAIGQSAVAGATGAVAIGQAATVTASPTLATDGIAIGRAAVARWPQSIAIGATAQTNPSASGPGIAIGYDAQANYEYAIAFGKSSRAQLVNTLAIGNNAQANYTFAIAIGDYATAGAMRSIAIGVSSNATATDTVAIGHGVSIGANQYSVAIGSNSAVSGARGTALGDRAVAATYGTALGQQTGAHSYGVVVGVFAKAGTQYSQSYATAIGYNALAQSANSICLGSNAWVDYSASYPSPDSIAIGNSTNVHVASTGSIAIGYQAKADDGGTNVNTAYSVVIGYQSRSLAANAIAIGKSVSAGHANTIAIGEGATTTAANTGEWGSSAKPVTFKAYADVDAPGGFAQQIGPWEQDNVAASQVGVTLYLTGSATRSDRIVVRPGSILGMVVYSNQARTAGTLAVTVQKNGGSVLSATLDGADTQVKATIQAKDITALASGDRVSVIVTTSGDWAPTTADITVEVLIEQ